MLCHNKPRASWASGPHGFFCHFLPWLTNYSVFRHTSRRHVQVARLSAFSLKPPRLQTLSEDQVYNIVSPFADGLELNLYLLKLLILKVSCIDSQYQPCRLPLCRLGRHHLVTWLPHFISFYFTTSWQGTKCRWSLEIASKVNAKTHFRSYSINCDSSTLCSHLDSLSDLATCPPFANQQETFVSGNFMQRSTTMKTNSHSCSRVSMKREICILNNGIWQQNPASCSPNSIYPRSSSNCIIF